MLKHNTRVIPFKVHPLFKKFSLQFENDENSKELLEILKKNIAFIYPKTISFSFVGYDEWLGRPSNFYSEQNDFEIFYSEGKPIKKPTIDSNLCELFFKKICSVFKELEFHPLIVLDVNRSTIFDGPITRRILKILIQNEYNMPLVVFSPKDLVKLIKDEIIDTKHIVTSDFHELLDDLQKLYLAPKYRKVFDVPEQCTNESLENLFKNCQSNIADKFVLDLNFINTKTMSFFAMNTLSLFIHTISHTQGIVAYIDAGDIDNKIDHKLSDFRFYKINRMFFPFNKEKEPADYNWKIFGTYMFNGDTTKKLLEIDVYSFMNQLAHKYSYWCNDTVRERVISQEGSYNEKTRYLIKTKQIALYNVIKELVENAALHSGGIGYLSIMISANILHLFVGDVGVGIKEGILKNYDINIGDTRSVFQVMFDLNDEQRKTVGLPPWERNAGFGLKDSISDLGRLNAKMIVRSGSKLGSFVNVVSKGSRPTKVFDSSYFVEGTQFYILIPLDNMSQNELPDSTDKIMSWEM